jgi:hypothetical protein
MQAESKQLSVQGARLKNILKPLENPSMKGLTQSISLIDTYAPTHSTQKDELYSKTDTLIITALLMQQLHALKNQCCLILDTLLSYQHYWQLQTLTPSWGHKLEQGPLKFISAKSYKDQVTNSLHASHLDIERYATYLGLLHDQIDKESLLSDEESLHNFIIETTFIIKACLDRTSYNVATIVKPDSIAEIRSFIVDHSRIIPRYCATTLCSVSYKRPPHIVRHWAFYTIAAACTLGAGIYWYKNPQKVSQHLANIQTAAKNFYATHVYEPIKNSWDTLLARKRKNIPPMDESTEEAIFEKQLLNYAYQQNNRKKAQEQLNSSLITERVKESVAQISAKIYAQDWIEQSKNPTFNAISPNGTILQIIALDIQRVKLIFARIIAYARQWEKDYLDSNQLNFKISSTIPAALLAYGTVHAAKKIYHPRETAYKNIKEKLVDIDRLLNTYSVSPISHAAQGLIHYHLFAIKKYCSYIPTEFRLPFAQDLKELGDYHFSIQQKMNTIARMHRAYTFLWS